MREINFNKFYKITPKVFNSWIQILLKLPDSILWLYNDNNTGRKNLLSEAKKLGIRLIDNEDGTSWEEDD